MILALTVISTLEPIRETYTFGQINILLAIAILFDLLILLPRGSKWAGIGIGLAAAVKLTPAIFIVYLLVSRRRRAAVTAAVTAVAASLAAFALMPRSSWHYWTHTLWGGEGLGNAAYTFNQSIYAMLARFSAPAEPNRMLWAVLVLIAVVAGLWRARRAALAGDEVAGAHHRRPGRLPGQPDHLGASPLLVRAGARRPRGRRVLFAPVSFRGTG